MPIEWNKSIKTWRKRNHDTQIELSEKLGISVKTLQRYEAGIKEPNISVLLKLSEIYNMSIDRLIGNPITFTADRRAVEQKLRAIVSEGQTALNLLNYLE